MKALIETIRRGDRRSLAGAMSLIEESTREAETLRGLLRGLTGGVPWWGITGPPGVGKSTLVDGLIGRLRGDGRRVGVVAVDPSSPVSDGALLGDRVRMMRHATDADVFIRSLATHGCEGGLTDGAIHCGRLLELAGFDPVLIETVGVGQNEVDVSNVADICAVVLAPGYGDDIQLTKAGLLEIADLVVVNKCDLPDANRLLQAAYAELGAAPPIDAAPGDPERIGRTGDADGNTIDIFAIEAKTGKDVDKLYGRLLECDAEARLPRNRERHNRRRVAGELKRSAFTRLGRALEAALSGSAADALVDRVGRGEQSLDGVVTELVREAMKERSPRT
ncbi:MAG: GTP-binding protein [Phycisphaerae bacterium]|jgi:LAO/AO transport system kinase